MSIENLPARIWLVRHGQTDWNAQRRIQGHTPTELNAAGKAEAQMLAKWFAGRIFATIWSSDLPRAKQTADAIAARHHLPVQTSSELRERELGPFEGKTWDEVRHMRSELTGSPMQNGDLADWTGVPGVEADAVLWQRVSRQLAAIAKSHQGDALVVSHGGVIKHTVCHVLGIPSGLPRRFPLSNGITAVLTLRADGFYLQSLLDIGLLAGQPEGVDTAQAPSA